MKYKIKQFQSIENDKLIKKNINKTWLCRVMKGSATVQFDLKWYRVTSKTVFIVPEGVRFKVLSPANHVELEVQVFDEPLMNVVYSLLGSGADFGTLEQGFWSSRTLGEPFGRLMELDYESLKIAIQEPGLTSRDKMVTACLAHLLLTIYNAVGNTSKTANTAGSGRSRHILNRFYELVGENILSGHRSSNFYADKLCVSERYLFRVCKNETGKSPKDIINEFLIGQIKNALLTTDLTNKQLALRFNFPDLSSFGQFFRRIENISPLEYRKRYK